MLGWEFNLSLKGHSSIECDQQQVTEGEYRSPVMICFVTAGPQEHPRSKMVVTNDNDWTSLLEKVEGVFVFEVVVLEIRFSPTG